jgi:DNA-binding beta-propeller fold protein YncE
MMKIILRFIIIGLLFFSCEKDENSVPRTINYVFSFSVDIRPQAIAINKASGFIYVANHHPSINDYSSKIQKYNPQGQLLNTVADFSSFDQGKYQKYIPGDICVGDNQNLYVLVNPLEFLPNDSWSSIEGINILQFDSDDNFIKEYDLSQFDEPWHYSAISYSEKYLYVTNGLDIKKISIDNNQVDSIAFPTELQKGIPISDMDIDFEGCFLLTGQILPADYDVSGCHLTKYNPTNNQVIVTYSIGRTGIMAAMLNNPGLTIDGNGNIYLATFYGMGLEIFNKNGKFIMQTNIKTEDAEDTRPIDVVLLNNEIYILDNLNNQILVYEKH